MSDPFRAPALYSHWSKVPLAAFKARWPNFSPEELASKDYDPDKRGSLLIVPDALDKLQALRTMLGKPLVITSAYRSPEHNRAVGGATHSQHPQGKAFDVVMANHNPTDFERAAVAVGFRGIGHYPHSNFMHIDDRGGSQVVRFKGTGANNAWFPETDTNFTPPPRPKNLKDTITELAPVATPALGVGVAAAQGDGPVQWAIAGVLLIATLAAAFWVFKRKQRTDAAA